MYDLIWSAMALVVFWVLGATAFSQIEGWTYGQVPFSRSAREGLIQTTSSNAIYMCMILSLTIGFGDYTPVQPAGRVVFIVYALMAVPIVTSFAVQTITGLVRDFLMILFTFTSILTFLAAASLAEHSFTTQSQS